jgi:predicted amidohydrolase YtcJ
MSLSDRWLLRDVAVAGARTDCRIRAGRIAELAPGLTLYDGERLLEGGGGTLLPGLADHHLHLRAAAAAAGSLDLAGGGLEPVRAEARDGADGWLRVIGAGVELTRVDLDAVWPQRPVRAQHRSGALWTLNSAALQFATGPVSAIEAATGQFWRPGNRLRDLFGAIATPDLPRLSAQLAAHGVTHVTDATPDLGSADLELIGGQVRQHLLSLAGAGTGPRKVVIADHNLPELDELTRQVRAVHAQGRGVAVHAVTAVALVLAIAAIEAAGPHDRDRIEHAAVCDDRAARRLAELDVTVVTQPSVFARHGAAFTADSDPADRPLLWRVDGFIRAGVPVALSSDAPYGDPDPWATIRAAATRAGPEQITPTAALTRLLTTSGDPGGAPRAVTIAAPADLCLLADDLPTTLQRVTAGGAAGIRATFVSGARIHHAP